MESPQAAADAGEGTASVTPAEKDTEVPELLNELTHSQPDGNTSTRSELAFGLFTRHGARNGHTLYVY
ncbi:hypothetical protein EWW49_33950, partial [Pseudomonas syringae]